MGKDLGFIGGGNMSTGIFNGILKSNAQPVSNIWVSGPHLENLTYWKKCGANVTDDNSVVYENCSMIFLGVKGDKLHSALQSIKPKSDTKKVTFISMLAGKKMSTLREIIHSCLPQIQFEVVRIMPNTPMTVGAGICLYTVDESGDFPCQVIENLLSGAGICEKIPESLMDSLGTLTACGPAFMYLIIEALADGAVKEGVPRNLALRHAAQMVVGSGEMVLQSGKHPGLLKDEVCSPGGSTICGITALENGKLRGTIINAIESATSKNKALGK